MSIERRHPALLGRLALALAFVASATACASSTATKAPAASASPPRESFARAARPATPPPPAAEAQSGESQDNQTPPDAELVVHRDVVAQCPTLRLVRAHADEFEADMVWLAVLDAIADCMREDGPLAQQNLGVSGDEAHRHVIREVLASRGVSPTRVVATPQIENGPEKGVTECQGSADCDKRIEITVLAAASAPGR